MTTNPLIKLIAALLLLTFSALSAAGQVEVSGGQINILPDGSQVVFNLSNAPAYRSFLLPHPPRFVVDLKDTEANNLHYALRSPDVRDIRSGNRNGTLRIVLDLTRAMLSRATVVRHSGDHLVLDLFRRRAPVYRDPASVAFDRPHAVPATARIIKVAMATHNELPPLNLVNNRPAASRARAAIQKPPAAPPAHRSQHNEPKHTEVRNKSSHSDATRSPEPKPHAHAAAASIDPKSLALPDSSLRRRDIIIAIDPGHGGKDTGAVGPDGIEEKNVVLAIGKKLKKLINTQPHLHAFLTRNRDIFIPLHQRITIAQQHKADLFISIHANSTPGHEPDATGSMVFMLSTKGASSTLARWLAKSENDSDEVEGPLDIGDRRLRKVVFDMVHDAVLADSDDLAKDVMQQLGDIGDLHSSQVERANFAVLKAPEIPSILIETAFISNPTEEHQLANGGYQERLARAIFHGVETYVDNRPGLGLRIADTGANTHSYTVRKGDTLSTIAQRYDVSLNNLIAINGLNNAHYIPAGMTIQIPGG